MAKATRIHLRFSPDGTLSRSDKDKNLKSEGCSSETKVRVASHAETFAIVMSDRVMDLLMVRCAGESEGWVFPADSGSGHITTIDKQFRKARAQAGLPAGLKLYCARHDYGTQMLQRTGNLALVMRAMGQTSTKAAMQYQHPDLEHIRRALNVTRAKTEQENRIN
jgi:site-specific recombinase XerC